MADEPHLENAGQMGDDRADAVDGTTAELTRSLPS
jgi:hypothetical protein